MTSSAWRSGWIWAGVSLGTALACTPDRSTAPDAPATPYKSAEQMSPAKGGLLGGLVGRLVNCTPMPAAHAARIIGPAGGTLDVGPHSLVVPAGALGGTVTITADAPSDTVNSVRFKPQGLTFASNHQAELRMSYANCPLLRRLLPKHIAYTTDLLQIIKLLAALDDPLRRQVSAAIAHFSRYAIAW